MRWDEIINFAYKLHCWAERTGCWPFVSLPYCCHSELSSSSSSSTAVVLLCIRLHLLNSWVCCFQKIRFSQNQMAIILHIAAAIAVCCMPGAVLWPFCKLRRIKVLNGKANSFGREIPRNDSWADWPWIWAELSFGIRSERLDSDWSRTRELHRFIRRKPRACDMRHHITTGHHSLR